MFIKNLIADVRQFLRKERFYGTLLILILFAYAFLLAFAGRIHEQESEAMAKIKHAEKVLKQDHSEQQVLEKFLLENPEKAAVVSVFLALLTLAFGIGLVVDFGVMAGYFRKRPFIPQVRTPGPVSWGGSDVAKVVILFFAVGLASNFVLAFFKAAVFKNWSENLLLLLHTNFVDFFILFLIIYFAVRKYGGELKDLGMGLGTWGKDFLVGILGYLGTLPLFFIVLLVLLALASLFSYEPPPHPLVEVFVQEDKKNPLLIGYSIFLACVIGPVIEEVFFRGFAYPALKKLWGVRPSMIVTSAVFAWTHNSSFAFWPIFVLGMVLSYLYEKRGSLLPSIVMHVTHNSLFILIFFLMKRTLLDSFL